MQHGAFRALSPHRGLHHAPGTYWLAALTAPQVSFNIRMSGTLHGFIVNLSFVFLEGAHLNWFQEWCDVSRLFCS